LSNQLKRLNQDPEVLKEYDSVIKEQLKNGIVEVVEKPADGEVGKTHYLPHHAVIRRDKTTTKLRVVYDASARCNGAALSDCLYTGPPLAENIFDILLRFRASREHSLVMWRRRSLWLALQRKTEMYLDFCGWTTLRRRTQRSWC